MERLQAHLQEVFSGGKGLPIQRHCREGIQTVNQSRELFQKCGLGTEISCTQVSGKIGWNTRIIAVIVINYSFGLKGGKRPPPFSRIVLHAGVRGSSPVPPTTFWREKPLHPFIRPARFKYPFVSKINALCIFPHTSFFNSTDQWFLSYLLLSQDWICLRSAYLPCLRI